jgi:formylglycine-generating enzyme required for sulfatase activity
MKLRKNSVYGVLRGGSHSSGTGILRVTFRIRFGSEGRDWFSGFRFVIRGKK